MKNIKWIKKGMLINMLYAPAIFADNVFKEKLSQTWVQGDVIGGASGDLSLILKIIIYCVGTVALFTGFKSLMHGVEKAKQPDGSMSDVLMGAGVAALVIAFGVVVIYIGGHYADVINGIKTTA